MSKENFEFQKVQVLMKFQKYLKFQKLKKFQKLYQKFLKFEKYFIREKSSASSILKLFNEFLRFFQNWLKKKFQDHSKILAIKNHDEFMGGDTNQYIIGVCYLSNFSELLHSWLVQGLTRRLSFSFCHQMANGLKILAGKDEVVRPSLY